MLVSYKWLKQFVNLPDSVTPEEVGSKLTACTLEVEKIIKQGENLDMIVVGKVETVQAHPNADRLKICTVAFGQSYPAQVVCGGSNVEEGMLVAFAPLGAKVRWHGEGELVELKKVKIRDVESHGMICASTEIGLGEMFPLKSEKEILDLTNLDLKVGQPLAQALNLDDAVLEIDNKSMTHRPDLWGHYGLAREVAVLYNKELKKYAPADIKPGKGLTIKVKIEDTELCRRYMAVAISGIKVGPSPEWLQTKLLAVGQRPINNIVDITNLLMFELAQPMHAFDVRDLAGGKENKVEIVVRRPQDKEKFTTLDGIERSLTNEMLVIADKEKSVALAGVMGGLNSEIKDDTTTIIYESANFDPTVIRKMSQTLGLRTESSARWEKNLDPNNAELALKRAVELTLELCPEAKVISPVADESHFKLNQGPIAVSLEFINKKIGIEFKEKEVATILERLGFTLTFKKGVFFVSVPTWRATKDISIPEDIVEEVARIYGYNNIPTALPIAPVTPPAKDKLKELERKIKEILVLEFGFSEVYNYSFVSPEVLAKLGEEIGKHLELANPIAKDRPFLRRYLLPGLLLNTEFNLHRFPAVKLFEVGRVFHADVPGQRAQTNSDELLPRQNTLLSLVYAAKNDGTPFYVVSEAVHGLLSSLGVKEKLEKSTHPHLFHPGRFAKVYIAETEIGLVSEIDPQVQKTLGIAEHVAVAELDLDELLLVLNQEKKYQPLAVYPEVVRDIAFVVDKKITHAEIVVALEKIDPLIVEVELFDVFQGNPLAPQRVVQGKKSMAYHITYLSPERTLESGEVDKIQERVQKLLEKEFKAEMRV